MTSSVKVSERTPAASARNSSLASRSKIIPSKAPLSALSIGTRSNDVASPLRTISTASSAVKPLSVATKVWSEPRGTVPLPGVRVMR